ncbi:MAG: hypothetical protein NZ483_11175, partial [Verrucomicrobiae bacterium]|nr:hypothetical protein [Verrucomicrobiae bacterium]
MAASKVMMNWPVASWLVMAMAVIVVAAEPETVNDTNETAEIEQVLTPEQLATAHFQLGVRMLDERKYLSAADAFERATQVAPKFFEAHLNWGIALMRLGEEAALPVLRAQRFREAHERFENAEKLNNRHRQLYRFWSETLMLWGDALTEPNAKLERYAAALEKSRRMTELDERDWEGYNRMGTIMTTRLAPYAADDTTRRQLCLEAARLFEQASQHTRFRSDSAAVYANWGAALTEAAKVAQNLQEKRSLLEAANQRFEQSARYVAAVPSTHAMWGTALVELARLSGLRKDLRMAAERLRTALQG